MLHGSVVSRADWGDTRAYCLRNYEIFLPFIGSRNHHSLCDDY